MFLVNLSHILTDCLCFQGWDLLLAGLPDGIAATGIWWSTLVPTIFCVIGICLGVAAIFYDAENNEVGYPLVLFFLIGSPYKALTSKYLLR